jgi:hypothetical protein
MKRSAINAALREAKAFWADRQIPLPPFATWTPEEWAEKGPEVAEIVDTQLGWAVSDLGRGDFEHTGLLACVLRSGYPDRIDELGAKTYTEKILMVKPGQVVPLHMHHERSTDIINRGGGRLVVQVYNSTPDEGLAGSEVALQVDGVSRTYPAGTELWLAPGESAFIPARVYHACWGEAGALPVAVGEISSLGESPDDTRFHQPLEPRVEIEEDEAPLHLLSRDYDQYYFVNPSNEEDQQ